MSKEGLAARLSLFSWISLCLASLVGVWALSELNDLSRAWHDLADIGIDPMGIVGSIALGWVLQLKFWVAVTAVGLCATLSWCAAHRKAPEPRREPHFSSAALSLLTGRSELDVKPFVHDKR